MNYMLDTGEEPADVRGPTFPNQVISPEVQTPASGHLGPPQQPQRLDALTCYIGVALRKNTPVSGLRGTEFMWEIRPRIIKSGRTD